MKDFIITSIEWDDESKTSGEVYVADDVNGNYRVDFYSQSFCMKMFKWMIPFYAFILQKAGF